MAASTLTSKRQTTFSVEIRSALGVKPGDKIAYEIEGDRVIMHSARRVVAALNGAL
jgi:bifunctional DNA-binding transcriptional regulator/antitoxin component of YhaV-PrlF toxin-antitoxin module